MQVVIVTLRDPVYNASTNTLNYTVSFVPGRHNGSIAEFYRRHKGMPNFTKVCTCCHSFTSILCTFSKLLP